MITVKLVCNDGDGMVNSLTCRDGTTLGQFLEVNFEGDLEDYTLSVRPEGGSSSREHEDYILQDNDRVTIAPKKVEGEVA